MKHRCAFIALLIVIMNLSEAYFPAAANADQSFASRLEHTVDAVVIETMATDHIPGAAVVVTMEDRIILKKGYGHADIERGIPVDPDRTVMPLGSLTKSMTATAIMRLKEQNQLKLEEDVNSYLTSFKIPVYRNQPITLQHLLTHTAGLDEALYGTTAASPARTVPLGDFLKRYFGQQPPVRAPGMEYAYSNAGFALAAFILEEITGSSLNDYLSDHLFKPLDMPSAALNAPESPNMARSYVYQDDEYVPLPYSYVNLPGAGGISAVPAEWAHYMIALLNEGKYEENRILNPDSVKEMHARHFTEHPDLESGVGYGFFRTRLENGLFTLSHTGDIDGFSAKIELIPSHKIGILVVSNASSHGIPLHDKVMSAIASLLPDSSHQAELTGVTPADGLHQYERTYTMNLGPQHGWGKWLRWLGARDYDVQSSSETLIIKGVFPGGSGETESRIYIPISDHLFRDQDRAETLSFRQENGIWKLVFTQGITIEEKPSWWRHPATAFTVYAAVGLFWVILFLIGILRYLLGFMLRKKQAPPGPIAWMATLLTVYLIGQLLYGNSEVITRGYPAWYALGFSSLPLLALAVAFVLGARAIRSWKFDTGKQRLQICFAVVTSAICVLYTGFLFYWNMLSIHYS